jgi:hypothetical protein
MADTKERPQNQTGENKGKIKRAQLDDRTMPEKDTARGSEPETRAASSRRS